MRLLASLVSRSFASMMLLGAYMATIGMGIYSFSHSIFWAIVGGLLGGKLLPLSTPVFIALEYYFNGGKLTVYSAILVGITIAQIIYAYWLSRTPITKVSIESDTIDT
jgi:hypothetical protein